jgi:hypothetical protein
VPKTLLALWPTLIFWLRYVQLSSSSDPLLHLGYMNVNKESPEYDGAYMVIVTSGGHKLRVSSS